MPKTLEWGKGEKAKGRREKLVHLIRIWKIVQEV